MAVTAGPEAARPVVVALAQGATILLLYGSIASIRYTPKSELMPELLCRTFIFSGGHYNPIVSFAVWLGGGVGFVLLLFFIICQVLGAFMGALLFRVSFLRPQLIISAELHFASRQYSTEMSTYYPP